jgi:tRNA threonylcarbamoyladenosine biosynthesis protein TsaB
MKLLAFETSSEQGSAALWLDGQILERSSARSEAHSARLLPQVSDLLAEAGLRLGELDAIAYGAGPGGFTGLRLACGVAQGLAFGAGLPVIGVSSLEAVACAAGRPFCYVVIDARMDEVYCAAYRVEDGVIDTLIGPCVLAPAAVPLPPGTGWHGCGCGFAAYGEALRARLGDALVAVDDAAMPMASFVAVLAARRLGRDGGMDAAFAQPLYVRDKVALTTAERLARGGKA